jgi:hypothetical protein
MAVLRQVEAALRNEWPQFRIKKANIVVTVMDERDGSKVRR